ncbi:DNA topology modulation protein FlaR [Algirhabdus cladophorae]|uniref:DNA topology modulation protein FlaR n=1 Tax=Algirhabdus cladophorae TaxID=3377108 RepID=UPI003B84B04C
MKRIVITGANGSGKSHTAARFSKVRPDVPVISFDAIKLTTGWQQKPRSEVEMALQSKISQDAWILEGGPSLLPLAMEAADAVVWLDPLEAVRTWRLIQRPWRFRGETRPELPKDNVDWPLQQYQFAWRSLKKRHQFRHSITEALAHSADTRIWHCRSAEDVENAVKAWGGEGR